MPVPGRIRFADCELDLGAFELRREGQAQPVEPQVFELLVYLARHPGRLISKDELIEQVWGGRNVSDAALSSRIKSARRAIGDDGEQQRFIRTVHGRGFRFAADVVSDAQPATPDPVIQTAVAQPQISEPPTNPRETRPATPVALAAGVGLVVAIAVLVIASLWRPTVSAPHLSVAVLPFASAANDPDTTSQADMLVEAITTRLSQKTDLPVVSRGASFAYKGKPMEPRAVGRDLNVRYVVSGSLRRVADDIQVDVQLIDVERSGELWAARPTYSQVDRALAPDRLAYRIAQSVEIRMLAAESSRIRHERPDKPDAVDLTTRGYVLLNKRMTVEINEQALHLFEAALAQDPNSVSALLGLARTNLDRVTNQWSPQSDRTLLLDRADEALRRVIMLAPNMSFAQRIRGGVLRARGDPDQAIAAFTRAIELDSNDANAHAELGRTKIDVGLAAETIGHIENALRINSNDRSIVFWYFWAGQAAVHLGDGETAAKWLRRAIEANPTYANPLPWLAVACVFAGRDDDARRYLDQLERVRPGMTISGWDAAYRRRNPIVAAQLERTYAALRQLGVPE